MDRLERQKNAIADLIAKHKWNELRTKVDDIQPADIADLLMRLEKRDRVLLFRAIPRELSANAFSELSHIDAQHFLHDLSDEETRALLTELEPDDRAELLEELPGVVVQKLLNLLDPGELAKTQALLGYPEESTGRLMTPGYVAIRPTWTATEALAHVRKRNPKSETVDVLYVTDEKWRLLGVLSLRQLIFEEPTTVVETFMLKSVVKALATDDREKTAGLMSKYNLAVLPVTDKDNILVGIVTVDDVMDVVEEETTEDFYKSAAVETLKMDLSDASVGILYRSRIGWLVGLIFINIIRGNRSNIISSTSYRERRQRRLASGNTRHTCTCRRRHTCERLVANNCKGTRSRDIIGSNDGLCRMVARDLASRAADSYRCDAHHDNRRYDREYHRYLAPLPIAQVEVGPGCCERPSCCYRL